jgi:hypothetical protein
VGALTPTPRCVFLAAPMLGNAVIRIALLAVLPLAACRCDDSTPPVRKAEQRRAPTSEEILAQLPKPEGTPIEPSTLATTLPPALGDATAEGDAQLESTPLGDDGQLSVARRVYVKGEQRITVQLTDALHAPLLRAAVAGAKAKATEKEGGSWKLGAVNGRDVALQYFDATSAAMANVIVTDRLFLNVRVEPADKADVALEWAQKIPLEPITKLQAANPAQAPSAQPPPL